MNTLQNVYDRLSDKTELAKHEVELGLIDDYKSLFSKATTTCFNISILLNWL